MNKLFILMSLFLNFYILNLAAETSYDLHGLMPKDTQVLTGEMNRNDVRNISGNFNDTINLGTMAAKTNAKRNALLAQNSINVGTEQDKVGILDRLSKLDIKVTQQELATILLNYHAFLSNWQPERRAMLPNPLPDHLQLSLEQGNGRFGPYLDLRGISIQGFNLSIDNLDDPTERINLSHANFRGAVLSGANFTGAKFDDADLSDAQMSGTIFNHASMQRCNLSETVVNPKGQVWPKSIYPTGKNLASFRNANLEEANLTNANFYFADLTDTNLHNSIYDNVDCSWANLSGTVLTNNEVEFLRFEVGKSYKERLYDTKYMIFRYRKTGKIWRVTTNQYTTFCGTNIGAPQGDITTNQSLNCQNYLKERKRVRGR